MGTAMQQKPRARLAQEQPPTQRERNSVVPANREEWLEWCIRVRARVVWFDYSDGRPSCKVRVDHIECESEGNFEAACREVFDRLARFRDIRGTYMRSIV